MASILVVDDSSTIRFMVSVTLKRAGYNVIEAADGIEAINIAKNESVNLVLTDVNMPNMDGITLVKELRALPSYKFTPMLVLAGESTDDQKAECKAAGVVGWLIKPFRPEKLLDTVKKIVS